MIYLIYIVLIAITSIILFTIGIGYLSEEEIKAYESTLKSYSPDLKLKISTKNEKDITNYGKGYIAAISNETKQTYLNVDNLKKYLKPTTIYKKISDKKEKLDNAIKYTIDTILRHEANHYTKNTSDEVEVQYQAYRESLKQNNKIGVYIAHKIMEYINPEVSKKVIQKAYQNKDTEIISALSTPEEEIIDELNTHYKPKAVQQEEQEDKKLEEISENLNYMNV